MVKQPIFKTLCIERDVFECSYVQHIIKQMPNAKIELIDNIAEQIDKTFVAPYPQDSEGAQKVFIGKQRGVFIRPCPCSLQTKRCGYHYLSLGVGCNMECSYCFLQGFLNTSSPILYTNFEDMECELQEWENRMQEKGKILRLGTGEMTDSLLFEPMTGYARILIQIFKKYPHLHLELKTKTPFVDNLLDIASQNVFLAWSLNPQKIIEREERGAATLDERLTAAKKATNAGYSVAFHFDPIIPIDGWESLYQETVNKIFNIIPAEKIAWISLGIFRIFPALRDTIRHRHPQTHTLLGELLPSFDGKLRYFKPQRLYVYKSMKQWIESYYPVPLYLCMESEDIWKEVFPNQEWFSSSQIYYIE